MPTPPPSPPWPLPFLYWRSLRLLQNSHWKSFLAAKFVQGMRFDGRIVEVSKISKIEDGEAENCCALPLAVALVQGSERMRDAVEDLKLNLPSTSSGFLRFQVAVPPREKAFNWFCSQPESSAVFPLFFVSKDTNDRSYKSLLNVTRGVFGVGSAVNFARDSFSRSGEWTWTKSSY